LKDKWLLKTYLEGGGGGNGGESYSLAWHFAAHYTSIDCFEKRGVKGLLITIGDEAPHARLSTANLVDVMGGEIPAESRVVTVQEMLDEVRKKYEVHHIHLLDYSGQKESEKAPWIKLLGENLHMVNSHMQIADKISQIALKHFAKQNSLPLPAEGDKPADNTESEIL